MYFLQMFNTPVSVTIRGDNNGRPDRVLRIPKFKTKDVVDWAEEIRVQTIEEITADMDEVKRREYLTFYPVVPPDMTDMKRRLKTPEGVRRIIAVSLPRAEVFKLQPDKTLQPADALSAPEIDHLVNEANGLGRLAGLAWVLADLDERSVLADPNELAGDTDPLSKSGKEGSGRSQPTGPKSSPSSTRRTQGSIPAT